REPLRMGRERWERAMEVQHGWTDWPFCRSCGWARRLRIDGWETAGGGRCERQTAMGIRCPIGLLGLSADPARHGLHGVARRLFPCITVERRKNAVVHRAHSVSTNCVRNGEWRARHRYPRNNGIMFRSSQWEDAVDQEAGRF